jgi:hypothetical protein
MEITITDYTAEEISRRRRITSRFKKELHDLGLNAARFARAFDMRPMTVRNYIRLIPPPSFAWRILADLRECPEYLDMVLKRSKKS